ncbi:MAG: SHD1 domain-containing protein [Chthoniobacterales bacterium]
MCFLLLFLMFTGGAFSRTFTDNQGRTIEAEIIGVTAEKVSFKLQNGKELSVPILQLSAEDQTFVREWKKTADSPEKTEAAEMTAAENATPGTPTEPWDYEAKAADSSVEIAKFRVWLPDEKRPVRGMLVLTPGLNGDGRAQVENKVWQDLARELNFGIIASFFKGGSYCFAQKGTGDALLEALKKFAKAKDHPEVEKAPLLLWGHSAGGQFNYNFACWKPERTIGFVVNKGGYYYDTRARANTQDVPALIFLGTTDKEVRVKNLTELFEKYRPRGALWALCPEEGQGHGIGNSLKTALVFFRSLAKLRLPPESALSGSDKLIRLDPASGWLGDLKSKEIAPANKFTGNVKDAAWLPDEATAQAWKDALN